MDIQPHIQYCQCVVCGDGCSIVANGDDAAIRVENRRLFSIFLRCVSSNNDDIDSSIVSKLDSKVNNYSDDGLVFCSTCKNALIKWDILYENLCVVIAQKLNRIKFMLYAKILNNSNKIDADSRRNNANHGEVNDGYQSLLFGRKIQQVKDQICRQFSPRVTLNRIPDSSDSRRALENLVHSFDGDEFEAFSEVHDDSNDDDGCRNDNSVPSDDPLSVEEEINDGAEVENKRGRKPFVLPNTVSKPIGPGTFLCGDRYIFFRKDNKFECGECSAVLKHRSHMVRHIRLKHVKGEDSKPFLDASESEGSKSKNLVSGFDGDEFEAFSDIQNDEHHDVGGNSQPKDNYSCSAEDYGRENNGGRKSFTLPNKTASKLICPGTFLYRDRFVFFQKNAKFECGECSAVFTLRRHILRHIRVKHMQHEVKELNYLGYRLTADYDGSFCCPVCHYQRKKSHIYEHLRELREKEQPGSTASKVSFKVDLTSEDEKVVVMPFKVEADPDPVTETALLETESNPEEIDDSSGATENPSFVKSSNESEISSTEILTGRSLRERRPAAVDLVAFDDEASSDQEQDHADEEIDNMSTATENTTLINNCEESKALSTEILPRRSVRKRRPASVAAHLVDFDDEASSDQEPGRASAGHDDDWEMASEGSVEGDNNMNINSAESGVYDEKVGKPSQKESTKGGKSNRKSNTETYQLISSGPDEWIYADKYKIIFNSEEERYYCGLCCAVNSEKAGLVAHIKRQHIDGKFTKQAALRQTGPNEYVYRDKYKVTVDNNADWYCGECGAQRKNKVGIITHIRESHINPVLGKRPRKFRTFDEVAPNEFLYNDKYSFRFDPDQKLYLCSLCDYTSPAPQGVTAHIRINHFTDAEKQQNTAVEVLPGEYLYGGRYKILLENGRYRCTLCSRTRQALHALYPHFRFVHPHGSADASQNPNVPQGNNDDAAQKPNELNADKADVPIPEAKKERMRQIKERFSLRRAIWKGWKIQGNGKWVYKNNWQVMVQNGKYKCVACDVEEGDRKAAFKHVQSVHAKEPYVVNPSAPVRRDEISELEYEGVTYKYDPFVNKYICGVCSAKSGQRQRMIQHIKDKHLEPQKFICDICGQGYDSKLIFQFHRARHEGPKYACKHCDKRFTSDRYLKTHLKIHMGEDAKKHQCEFCGKKFYDVKQLKNHRPIHTGEKPFPCDLCRESFSSTFKRREHRKKFHGGVPQKHGWKSKEGDVAVPPVYLAAENCFTATEMESDTTMLDSFAETD